MLDGQTDFLQPCSQDDLFAGAPQPVPDWTPKPEAVRAELAAILATLRAAETMPWSARRAGLEARTFPQMCRWLSDDEAEQMKFDFFREMERLQAR